MARFLIPMTPLFALTPILTFCFTSFDEVNAGDIHRPYNHGDECRVYYDAYCLKEASCFFSVYGEGTACFCPEMYGGVKCEKYMCWISHCYQKNSNRLSLRNAWKKVTSYMFRGGFEELGKKSSSLQKKLNKRHKNTFPELCSWTL